MHAHQFLWVWLLRFRRLLLSKTTKFPFWGMENLIDWNRLINFMQVGIDVTCMHTNFGGHGLFAFRDSITSQKWPNFPFGAWTIVHGHQKI